MSMNIDQLSEPRQSILFGIKNEGSTTIAKLSLGMDMTKEAIRQHIMQPETEGWIEKKMKKQPGHWAGDHLSIIV